MPLSSGAHQEIKKQVKAYAVLQDKIMARTSSLYKENTTRYKMVQAVIKDWFLCQTIVHGNDNGAEDILRSLSSGDKLGSLGNFGSNFYTEDLVGMLCPELSEYKLFRELATELYGGSSQRSAGKGEVLLSLISRDSEKCMKDGDIRCANLEIECKANKSTFFPFQTNRGKEVIDALNERYYGLTVEQIKEHHRSYHPLYTKDNNCEQVKNFLSDLYTEDSRDMIREAVSFFKNNLDPTERSQKIGYLALCNFLRNKPFDAFLLTEEKKDGKIKAVFISDPSDEYFISKHVVFKPQKMRGGSTEARPDGLVNMGIR